MNGIEDLREDSHSTRTSKGGLYLMNTMIGHQQRRGWSRHVTITTNISI